MSDQRTDIHHNEDRLKWNKKKFTNSEHVTQSNKEAVKRFIDKCYAEGLSDARVKKYITNFHTIFKLSEDLNFELTEADRDDIEKVVARIEKSEYAETTKSDFKACLKKYYKLIEGEGYTYPDKVKFFSQTRDKPKMESPDPLTKKQIDKIIDETQNKHDTALYRLAYEGALRPQELLSLNISDIEFIEKGVRVKVDGKAGDRQILVVKSEKPLKKWLDRHPLSDVREAPLWSKLQVDSEAPMEELRLGYNHFRLNLKRLSKKAEIRTYNERKKGEIKEKSEVYPYLFRHGRATHIATEMSEASMKAYMGWNQSSEMCEVYIHLSGRDTDDEVLGLYGRDGDNDQCNFCPNCGEELPD